jgi:hypothetical protein
MKEVQTPELCGGRLDQADIRRENGGKTVGLYGAEKSST